MLHHEVRRSFATRVCIVAGSQSHDYQGAVIMKALKKLSKEPVEFIGVGGKRMESEDLDGSLIDVGLFRDKPFYPYKNFTTAHLEKIYHLPTWPTKWVNYQTYNTLKGKNQSGLKTIVDFQPDVYLVLGNLFFMNKFYKDIANLYQDRGILKPPTTYYDSLVMNMNRSSQEWVDHMFYTVPREPVNWQKFKFPSTYVGKWVAQRALAYLYRNSPEYEKFVKENTIYLNELYNQEIVEGLIAEEGKKFRSKHQIGDTATVMYTLPGNTSEEIQLAMPLIHASVNQFVSKFTEGERAVAKENFVLVITTEEVFGKEVKEYVRSHSWPCKVILTETAEEKYSALAAGDLGLVMNGDAAVECAVYQLPTMVVDKSGFFDTYFALLYNSFTSDVNIARNGEIYPELHHGQANPAKVSDVWKDWYLKPKLRFRYVNLYEKYIPKFFPEVADQVSGDYKPKSIVKNNVEFKEHYFGDYLVAKKMLDAVEVFKTAGDKDVKKYDLPMVRKNLLEKLNPGYAYLAEDYLPQQ
mmetsp:Transcript_15083/g.17403  ORF Transcript_15083/g.17403 Transcript_15083/m.17403 type:complete len:523 (+) Transcript_15083:56-1624(+)